MNKISSEFSIFNGKYIGIKKLVGDYGNTYIIAAKIPGDTYIRSTITKIIDFNRKIVAPKDAADEADGSKIQKKRKTEGTAQSISVSKVDTDSYKLGDCEEFFTQYSVYQLACYFQSKKDDKFGPVEFKWGIVGDQVFKEMIQWDPIANDVTIKPQVKDQMISFELFRENIYIPKGINQISQNGNTRTSYTIYYRVKNAKDEWKDLPLGEVWKVKGSAGQVYYIARGVPLIRSKVLENLVKGYPTPIPVEDAPKKQETVKNDEE
jgi:hypothetical protein